MPKFVTIGYGERASYDRTPAAVRDAAQAADARLVAQGAVIGIAGAPVQVRNPEAAGVEVTAGAFMTSAMPLAGFSVIEAPDLDAAIAMVAGVPCAVAHGVVEIWPLGEPFIGRRPVHAERETIGPERSVVHFGSTFRAVRDTA
jgi:hypothetical protein